MKVAAVEAFLLHERFVFVKVTADDGRAGWGEAAFHGAATTARLVQTLAPKVVGRSAADTHRLWHDLFQEGFRIGSTGAHLAAIGGIDLALWDLKGRALGVPVSDLLGGRLRDRVPVYASMMARTRTPADHVRHTRIRLEQGFRAVKLHTGDHWARGAVDHADATVDAVRAIRDEIGGRDVVEVFVDVNHTYDAQTALRVGRQLEALEVGWLEEPLAPWDLDGYRRLSEHLALPIAAGEQTYNLHDFRALIEHGNVTVLQPNLTSCGGLTQGLKVAALAEAFDRTIACHNTSPTVTTAAQLHFSAAATTANGWLELFGESRHPLLDHPVLATPLRLDAGWMPVPDGPGFGIEVDEDAVRAAATPF